MLLRWDPIWGGARHRWTPAVAGAAPYLLRCSFISKVLNFGDAHVVGRSGLPPSPNGVALGPGLRRGAPSSDPAVAGAAPYLLLHSFF